MSSKIRSSLDVDFDWLMKCKHQLEALASQEDTAELLVETMDKHPELRNELSHIYVKALKTLGR